MTKRPETMDLSTPAECSRRWTFREHWTRCCSESRTAETWLDSCSIVWATITALSANKGTGMNKKLLHSLGILTLAFSAAQSQMSVAQPVPDSSFAQPSITHVTHAANSTAVSTTTQGIGAHPDAAAQG